MENLPDTKRERANELVKLYPDQAIELITWTCEPKVVHAMLRQGRDASSNNQAEDVLDDHRLPHLNNNAKFSRKHSFSSTNRMSRPESVISNRSGSTSVSSNPSNLPGHPTSEAQDILVLPNNPTEGVEWRFRMALASIPYSFIQVSCLNRMKIPLDDLYSMHGHPNGYLQVQYPHAPTGTLIAYHSVQLTWRRTSGTTSDKTHYTRFYVDTSNSLTADMILGDSDFRDGQNANGPYATNLSGNHYPEEAEYIPFRFPDGMRHPQPQRAASAGNHGYNVPLYHKMPSHSQHPSSTSDGDLSQGLFTVTALGNTVHMRMQGESIPENHPFPPRFNPVPTPAPIHHQSPQTAKQEPASQFSSASHQSNELRVSYELGGSRFSGIINMDSTANQFIEGFEERLPAQLKKEVDRATCLIHFFWKGSEGSICVLELSEASIDLGYDWEDFKVWISEKKSTEGVQQRLFARIEQRSG